jgi:hypothetical protein
MPTRLSVAPKTETSLRIDVEFAAVTALREVMITAQREPVSYPEAMALGAELYPGLLSPEKSLLYRAQDPLAVRAFREKAEAASIREEKEISAVDIVNREIRELQQLIAVKPGRTRDMKRELATLYRHLEYLKGARYSEHNLIARDVFAATRPRLPKPPIERDRYQHYDLGRGRSLNIMMLHPDKPEHVSGADVVYEICSLETEEARVALVQYKVWENDSIPHSRLDQKQLNRMRDSACKKGLCFPRSKKAKEAYRLPYCSAFVRLTDRLQKPDARLVSAGLFVPICKLPQLNKGDALDRADISNGSVSSDIFEAALIEGSIGSDWHTFAEIENLYRQSGIFNADDRIVIHAQEY